jgi:heme-degrading monooxygenase HmoA
MADHMVSLASQMPGFLGVESVRDANGLGVTVSYWESEDTIRQWKAHSEHQAAQAAGKKVWYTDYIVRVAKVVRTLWQDFCLRILADANFFALFDYRRE